MSYKDELKKQIEQLEASVDVDKVRLQQLYRELADVQLKERFGDQSAKVELLKG